jgi:ElaB/YqjD/DUF883 family membrane-anchored ribosome-binding protein
MGNYGDYASYMPGQQRDQPDTPERAIPAEPDRAGMDSGVKTGPGTATKPDTGATGNVPKNEQIKERIDTAIHDTADRMRDVAHRLEQYGQPGSAADQYTDKVARQINRGAEYLESANVDRLTSQLKDNVRRNPLVSIGVAFGVGFVLARVLKR